MNDIYPLTLLYDGDCAICRFEVASLERRDKLHRLRFVDIAAPGFDAGRWGRRNGFARFPSAAELDARIHAATAGHEILVGFQLVHGALLVPFSHQFRMLDKWNQGIGVSWPADVHGFRPRANVEEGNALPILHFHLVSLLRCQIKRQLAAFYFRKLLPIGAPRRPVGGEA